MIQNSTEEHPCKLCCKYDWEAFEMVCPVDVTECRVQPSLDAQGVRHDHELLADEDQTT